MSVSFGPVGTNYGSSVSLSGVTNGQPILLFLLGSNTPPSISDNFLSQYTWTLAQSKLIAGPYGNFYLYAYVGTGGYGTSGTITSSGGTSPLLANALVGASGLSGTNVFDLSGASSGNSLAIGGPSLTPGATLEGAIYAALSGDFADGVNITSDPSSPWVVNSVNVDGSTGFLHVASYASPPTSALAPSWGLTNTEGFYETLWASVGLIVKPLVLAAPNAPTNLSPVNAAYVDVSGGINLSAQYNSTDTYPQSFYSLRLKLSGGTYGYWNGTDFSSTAQVWNAITTLPGGTFTVPIPNGVAVPGGTLSNGNNYNFSFASEESSSSLRGSFAADFAFTAQATPVATITSPVATVRGTTVPVIAWTDTLPGTATQTAYRIVVESGGYGTIPGSGAVAWDSGVVASALTSITCGATLSIGTTYRFFVQITESGGQTSVWTYTTEAVLANAPAVPTVTVVDGVGTNGLPCAIITVQANDNQLTAAESSLETGVTTGWTAGANTTLGISSAWFVDGAHSLTLTAMASGAVGAVTPAGLSGSPVTPGTVIRGLAVFRSASTVRSCTVGIAFYGAGGALLSTTTGTAINSSTAGVQAYVSATVPAGAAFAALVLTGSGLSASEVLFADNMLLGLGTSTAWTIGGFIGTTSISVTCSNGNYVRNASSANPVTVPTGQVVTIYDYEAPTNTPVTYSAFVTASNSGSPLTSAAGVSNSVSVTTAQWWIWVPSNPALSVAINRASKIGTSSGSSSATSPSSGGDGTIVFDRDEDQGVFMPFGRPDTVVVHGDLRSERFSLTMVFVGDANYLTFDAIRTLQGLVAVRSDLTSNVYFMTMAGARSALVLRGDYDEPGGANRQLTMDFLPGVRPAV